MRLNECQAASVVHLNAVRSISCAVDCGLVDDRHIVQPVLHSTTSTRAEQVERCRREVTACRRAGQNASLTHDERFGAMQGEVDWLLALQMAEEEEPPQCAAFQDGSGVHLVELR